MNQANLAILERVRSNHTSGGVFSDRLRRTWGGVIGLSQGLATALATNPIIAKATNTRVRKRVNRLPNLWRLCIPTTLKAVR